MFSRRHDQIRICGFPNGGTESSCHILVARCHDRAIDLKSVINRDTAPCVVPYLSGNHGHLVTYGERIGYILPGKVTDRGVGEVYLALCTESREEKAQDGNEYRPSGVSVRNSREDLVGSTVAAASRRGAHGVPGSCWLSRLTDLSYHWAFLELYIAFLFMRVE